MANNYVQFSTMLETRNDTERTWLQLMLQRLNELDPEDPHVKLVSKTLHIPADELDYYPSFSYKLEEAGLWMYSEESGNVDQVTELMRAFLAKFRPNECFSFTWACTCSEPRLDEFGGGGVFITAKKLHYNDAGYANQKKEAQWRKRQERRSASGATNTR